MIAAVLAVGCIAFPGGAKLQKARQTEGAGKREYAVGIDKSQRQHTQIPGEARQPIVTTEGFRIANGSTNVKVLEPSKSPEVSATPEVPGKCTDIEVLFEGASLSGKIRLTTPTALANGSPASGTLGVRIYWYNAKVGEAADLQYGVPVEIPVTVPERAGGRFEIVAYNNNGSGPSTVTGINRIGPGVPAASQPELSYTDGRMILKWEPVKKSNPAGFFIDENKMVYNVTRHDGTQVAKGIKATEFSETVAWPKNMQYWNYTVTAECDGLSSEAIGSNYVTIGDIGLPYVSGFHGIDLDGWTVINANGDKVMWEPREGKAFLLFSFENNADDWLISPALPLEAGKAYRVSFMAHGSGVPGFGDPKTERLEVKYGRGNTMESMTGTLLDATEIPIENNVNNPLSFEVALMPDATGDYNIGFHGISDKNQNGLYIYDVLVDEGISSSAPGKVSQLIAEPDPNGEYAAIVSFTAPDKTIAGATLSGITEIELHRNGKSIHKFTTPQAGERLNFKDEIGMDGEVVYTVVCRNEDGDGFASTTLTYVGYAEPVAPENVKITRTATPTEVKLTWDRVTNDIHGLSYPEGGVKYVVVVPQDGEWRAVSQPLGATEYTFKMPGFVNPSFVQVGVIPVYEGIGGAGTTSEMLPMGTPYKEIKESFSNCATHYIWAVTGTNFVNFDVVDDNTLLPSQDRDNGKCLTKAYDVAVHVDLMSGLVSLKDKTKPGVTFYTYNIEGIDPWTGQKIRDLNELTVFVRTDDTYDWTPVLNGTVDELCNGIQEQWGRIYIDLTAYTGKDIQLMFRAESKNLQYTFLDNIFVGEVADRDIAVEVAAPQDARNGKNYAVDVTVTNRGLSDASGVRVEFYTDDKLVETREIGSIPSYEKAGVTFNCIMSPVGEDKVRHTARVVYDRDMVPSNNEESVEVTPFSSIQPKPLDLAVSLTDEGVAALSWTAPDCTVGKGKEVIHDFEDGVSFAEKYGDWTFVDVDKFPLGGFDDLDIPGITVFVTTGSFWIWDVNKVSEELKGISPHSGSKCLFSWFRADDNKTDDWAISPELSGEDQTISFYAQSIDNDFPENIEVLYSTGSLDPNDFMKVGKVGGMVPAAWTRYDAELPQGAKRFAIRSTAAHNFMLMIDDVTFIDGSNVDLELEGYNVYRNGEKIGNVAAEETAYTDANVKTDGDYTYVVTAMYKYKGESGPSNKCTLRSGGLSTANTAALTVGAEGRNIVVSGAESMDVTVVSATGITVASLTGDSRFRIPVEPGIYIVKCEDTARKIVVR